MDIISGAIAALGGWVDDLTSNLSHTYFGPELLFPCVLAGLSFGYVKNLGWLEGGSAWGQINWQASEATRLSGRFSWHQTAASGTGALPERDRDHHLGHDRAGALARPPVLGARARRHREWPGVDALRHSLPGLPGGNVLRRGGSTAPQLHLPFANSSMNEESSSTHS